MEGLAMPSAGTATTPVVPHLSFSWRKSSHSNPSGECVELSRLAGTHVGVRYSHHPDGPTLILSHAIVAAFIQRVKNGDFDEMPR
jgi:hypothetical protein